MVLEGADVAELRRLAATFDRSASRLQQIVTGLSAAINGTPAWAGGDAQRFRTTWNDELRAKALTAATALHDGAGALGRNADQQERASEGAGGAAPAAAAAATGAASVRPVPPGTSAAATAAWWAGLTPAERAYLIAHDYQALGGLHGLPSQVVDEVNRHRLADDEERLRQELQRPDLTPSQVDELRHRLAQDEKISSVIAKSGPGHPPAPILLLAFEPDDKFGQTGVEISYGDPDTAAHVGVLVPGTGNSALNLEGPAKTGTDLYNTMTGSKAVVVWLDGPEPQSVVRDAGLDHWADDSAPRLVADLAGLRAAHEAASGAAGHTALIGHSYGSYIAGKALSEGGSKYVDDAVFVGSPGVGVDHAADLGLSPQHVWSGQAGDDPILFVGRRFTPDPLTGNNPEDSAFGDQHFSVSGSHGHSEYFQGESLANIARIADGDVKDVDRVGAPDYRGGRELPGDALSAALDLPYAEVHGVKDLLTGHPIRAGEDLVHGAAKSARDSVDAVVDAGKSLTKGIEDLLP